MIGIMKWGSSLNWYLNLNSKNGRLDKGQRTSRMQAVLNDLGEGFRMIGIMKWGSSLNWYLNLNSKKGRLDRGYSCT